MKIILIIYVCSITANTCMPPLQIEKPYEDMYTCHIDGYKKSIDILQEMGKKEVNEHEIYTKFVCRKILEV
tara:strand:+ start:117 stop:329 length:213 start_codon:yes stop_codon:yes gene_type:complete